MIKIIFKTAWDKYMLHLGSLIVVNILMFISYLVLLKLTILGGELLKPFFLYGMFNVLLNHSDFKISSDKVVVYDADNVEGFIKEVHKRPEKIDISFYLVGFKDKNTAFKILSYGFLKTIFLAIGLALLVLPGIYFEIATVFAIPLIVTKNCSVIESFKSSIKLFNENWVEMSVVILILIILNCLTAFPYGFFSIFTIPFSIAVIAASYEVITTNNVKIDK